MTILPLRARSAEMIRRGHRLVGPIDVDLDGRGTTVVLGPNGAGKTSLLRLLHGIVRRTQGTVEWARPLGEARRRQAFVFQRPTMLRRSVLDNVAYPMRLAGAPWREARVQARPWLDRIGLASHADRPAVQLSGGEAQKLALARALVMAPDVLFLDEPTASLDGRATREIEAILGEAAAGGTRLVMSTHDLGQARRLADEVWFLLHGRLHEHGPSDRFFAAPRTDAARAFLRGDIVV